jgi:hypothetical protein
MVCCRRGGGGTPSKEECRLLYPISFEESRDAWPVTKDEARDKFPVTTEDCVDGGLCPEPPDGPNNFALVSEDNTSATFTWDAVDGAAKYRFCRCIEVTTLTNTDGCLVEGTAYHYTVSGILDDGTVTGPSNEIVWVPPNDPEQPPPPVTDFTAETTSGVYRITLNWQHTGERVKSFHLERRRTTETQWRLVARNIAPDARQWVDASGLSAGVDYVYRIRAVGTYGESTPVTVSVRIPLDKAPAPFLGRCTIAETTTSLTTYLDYTDPERLAITGFKVEIRADGEEEWTDVPGSWNTDPQATNVTATGLQARTSYEMRAQALADPPTAPSDWSTVRLYETALPPLVAPPNLFVDSRTQHSVDLHWDGVVGARQYRVTLVKDGVNQTPVTTMGTWISLELEPSSSYRALVVAERADLEGPASEVSFNTAAATPKPTNMMVTNVYIDSWNVRVRWKDSVQNGAYLVELIKEGDSEPTRTQYGCSGEAGVTLANIPGGRYTVQVRAEVTEFSKSEWTVKTGHVVPNTPP